MSKEEFIERQYYIAKKDTWFIEGTKCLYVEHVYGDRGIFEGKIKLENTTTKSYWVQYKIGDIIEDREMCGYDEFEKPKQREMKKENKELVSRLLKASNEIHKKRLGQANYIHLSSKHIQQRADEEGVTFDEMVKIIEEELKPKQR